jgi:hypothetical protein
MVIILLAYPESGRKHNARHDGGVAALLAGFEQTLLARDVVLNGPGGLVFRRPLEAF